MTDFIHEPPKDEAAPAPQHYEPPMDEKTGQKRVYGYIFILFVVAFGLLLWSFFINQRSADQVLSELRGNADALQVTLERNVELERRTDELEARVETLTKEKEALEQSAAQQKETEEALDAQVRSLSVRQSLCCALLLMNDGEHEAAARLLASYSTADYLKEIETNDGAAGNDGEAPVLLGERYDAMVEQLVKEGCLTIAEDGSLKSWHVAS